jgi:hypothetical protein
LIVIDDQLLQLVVARSDSPSVRPYVLAAEQGEVFTTGYWYWRLARAVAHPSGGVLSGRLRALPEESQRHVYAAMQRLPDRIGILTLRRLVPVMAALPGQVNALTAEAVATAIVVEGSIAVTTDSAATNECAGRAGIEVEIVRLERSN